MEIQLWRALRSMGSNSRPTTLDPVREFGRFRARRCPTVFRRGSQVIAAVKRLTIRIGEKIKTAIVVGSAKAPNRRGRYPNRRGGTDHQRC
jgi:hypothetical protein